MRFNIDKKLAECVQEPCVGNVYAVRGGRGAQAGHMAVIVSINEHNCTTLTITSSGDVVGGSNYGVHYYRDKCPIAFCHGLDDLTFDVMTI